MRLTTGTALPSAIVILGILALTRPAAAQPAVNLAPAGDIADDGSAPGLLAQAVPDLPGGAPGAVNGSASGIATNPSNNMTRNLGTRDVPLPISGPPLTGLFPSIGRTLLDDGIDIHGLAFDHFLANPSAGNIVRQTYNIAAILPAVDFDLGKSFGLTGGNVHFQFTVFGLRSNIPGIVTDAGGQLTGYQTTPTPSTTTFILSELTYEQKLLNDKLSIEVGRTNAFHYFLLPNGLDFFNDTSSTFLLDGDFNANPFPNWGGRATYHLTPKWFVQGGAFEDSYHRAIFNPDNFGVGGAAGAQILGEVGYRSEFNNADYPANFELGAEWDTRHGYYNTKGGATFATPRNQAADYSGGGVLFFQGAQVLWRGPRSPAGPPANIALYGSVDAAVDKPQPIDMDALVGVNFTGVLPGRPFDAIGLQAHYQRLSAVEANFETTVQNIFAGPGSSQSRNNYAFEMVANIAVTPWLVIDPTVQYFVQPDNLFDPAQRRRPTDGFIAGAFAVIPLGPLFGTSNKPF